MVVLVEVIEGMEKFLLRRFLAGDKLDIVDEEQVGIAVFIAELIVPALLQGGNQLVCKLIALDIDDIIAGVVLMHDAGDGVKQVRFAKAGRAVNKRGYTFPPGYWRRKRRRRARSGSRSRRQSCRR